MVISDDVVVEITSHRSHGHIASSYSEVQGDADPVRFLLGTLFVLDPVVTGGEHDLLSEDATIARQ